MTGTDIGTLAVGAGLAGVGLISTRGPRHFVLRATTSARRASEANFALGCA